MGEHNVSLDTWNRYREGDTVTIEYLQDNPVRAGWPTMERLPPGSFLRS